MMRRTVAVLIVAIATLLGLAGTASASPDTYSVYGETNVSARERGQLVVRCHKGDVVKWRTITTKAHYSAFTFRFTKGEVRGGVLVEYRGQRNREQTLTVRIVCRNR